MPFCAASSEVTKLQQHLTLLKEEYGKLQSHCAEVERKYTLAAASAGDLSETSFVARLLMTVATLYGRETYSDIAIKLQSKSMPGHKFVLNARSDDWNEEALKNLDELGKNSYHSKLYMNIYYHRSRYQLYYEKKTIFNLFYKNQCL